MTSPQWLAGAGVGVVLNDYESSSTGCWLMSFYGTSQRVSSTQAEFGPASSFLSLTPTETLRLAWVNLLARYPWDLFASLTWARPAGEEQVRRDFLTWLYQWLGNVAVSRGLARWVSVRGGQRLRGWWVNQRRKGREEPVYVLGIEPHESGRLHAHAVIRFPACFGEVVRREGWQLWFDQHGFAKLEPPKSQGDVAGYVSKYVLKPGADLVIAESFRAVL